MTIRSLPLVLAAVSAALLLSLSGCAGGGGGAGASDPAPVSGASSDSPGGSESVDVFTIAPGDCVNDSADDEVTELPVVDCSGPHDYEAFTQFDLTGTDYPGADAVSDEANATCAEKFDDFIGVSYEESALDVNVLTPTEESWNERDDRTVICLVFDPAGPLTGTVEGAAL